MIPKNSDVTIQLEEEPSLTYKLTDQKRVTGYLDNLESVKQAIYLILSVERYQYLIYSWAYGFEVNDLYGRSRGYVYPELKRRIKEALTQDDRISNVINFKFRSSGDNLIVTFTAKTIYGDTEEEVSLNV